MLKFSKITYIIFYRALCDENVLKMLHKNAMLCECETLRLSDKRTSNHETTNEFDMNNVQTQ